MNVRFGCYIFAEKQVDSVRGLFSRDASASKMAVASSSWPSSSSEPSENRLNWLGSGSDRLSVCLLPKVSSRSHHLLPKPWHQEVAVTTLLGALSFLPVAQERAGLASVVPNEKGAEYV
ncbi:hypothetical protein POM88_014406 [Heracleum sosnowskyi]|uniref:Uncharacterized protein n=1 Tax=Heracleum sosnowskyi TaxID=360622 RepID=A0AAD8J403_9APIA|nr:hypothetical protein POM88_014406 [Heracleum sosnowskyi]